MLTTDFVTKQVFRNLDVDVGKKKKTPLDNITQKPSEEPDLKWNLLWVTPDSVIMATPDSVIVIISADCHIQKGQTVLNVLKGYEIFGLILLWRAVLG